MSLVVHMIEKKLVGVNPQYYVYILKARGLHCIQSSTAIIVGGLKTVTYRGNYIVNHFAMSMSVRRTLLNIF